MIYILRIFIENIRILNNYSETCLKRTLTGTEKVSALDKCLHRSEVAVPFRQVSALEHVRFSQVAVYSHLREGYMRIEFVTVTNQIYKLFYHFRYLIRV